MRNTIVPLSLALAKLQRRSGEGGLIDTTISNFALGLALNPDYALELCYE